MITIRGPNGIEHELPIDVRAELEDYEWHKAEWHPDKLNAASPFRYERNPSFAVIFEHGGWRDYGAEDDAWTSGSFQRLLSFLRQETYEETADYLLAKYGDNDNPDEITLRIPKLAAPIAIFRNKRLPADYLRKYTFDPTYLKSRSISEITQRYLDVRYDTKRRAVVIPWHNPDGSIANVKFRKTESKAFWYAGKARPIREMLYGIHIAYNRMIRKAAIVEAEIDALTLMSAGIYAIATGGTAFNRAKAELILRSPIEELTIYRDNDKAGRSWRNAIVRELSGKIDVKLAAVPAKYKDVNEAVMAGWDVKSGNLRKIRTFPNFNVDTSRLPV